MKKGFNNQTARRPSLQTDEGANQAILNALSKGPLYLSQIAERCHKSSQVIQQRLYRMEKKLLVVQEGGRIADRRHYQTRWGLPGQVEGVEKKPVSEHTAKSRAAPDWKNTTLKYDLDAHRRLAMMAR